MVITAFRAGAHSCSGRRRKTLGKSRPGKGSRESDVCKVSAARFLVERSQQHECCRAVEPRSLGWGPWEKKGSEEGGLWCWETAMDNIQCPFFILFI